MGETFQEQQRVRVACPKSGVEVAVGSLLTHRQSQNVVGRGDRGGGPYPATPRRPKLTGSLSLNVYCGSGARWRGIKEGF